MARVAVKRGCVMTQAEALLLSIAIEAPAAWAGAYLTGWYGRGAAHVAGAMAVATAVTHPQLWAAALLLYPHAPVALVLMTLEGLVVVAEGLLVAWIAGLRLGPALTLSLLANMLSLLVGLLLA
jgi:hypothetical protein